MQTLRKGSRGNDVRTLQRILHLFEDGIFGSITEESVKAFQRANNITEDGIVGNTTWKLLLAKSDELVKSKRNINEIIVHCTATPDGRPVTIREITQWHKNRGFSTIGYHYVVMLDGTVCNGRNVDIVGAHCTNHNSNSIGVCYVGGLDKVTKQPKDTRTPAQKYALTTLLKKLKALYPKAKIYGHRDFSSKACPCFDAKREYSTI